MHAIDFIRCVVLRRRGDVVVVRYGPSRRCAWCCVCRLRLHIGLQPVQGIAGLCIDECGSGYCGWNRLRRGEDPGQRSDSNAADHNDRYCGGGNQRVNAAAE